MQEAKEVIDHCMKSVPRPQLSRKRAGACIAAGSRLLYDFTIVVTGTFEASHGIVAAHKMLNINTFHSF